jgi:serine/threonine-protein phosphatase 6 regulatory ankyrin repeat subunit B
MTPELLQRRIAAGANVNERMASNGDTPLMLIAMVNPDPETVQVLVDAGADVNTQNENRQTALWMMFDWGQWDSIPEKARILLKAGAEVDTPRHYTPLNVAIMRRHWSEDLAPVLESLSVLLDAGADVNTPCWFGLSPLMLAVTGQWSDIEVVRLLIEAGADVNARRDSYTVLMYSVISNWKGPPSSGAPTFYTQTPEIVKLLIDGGADVNAQSKDGWTALMVAARWRTPEFVRVLIDAGTDIHIKNDEGLTALMLAKERGHTEIVELLIEAGAEE